MKLCASQAWMLRWRWLLLTMVVGTILVGINQANIVALGDFSAVFVGKIVLTYVVAGWLVAWVNRPRTSGVGGGDLG